MKEEKKGEERERRVDTKKSLIKASAFLGGRLHEIQGSISNNELKPDRNKRVQILYQ